ncbi:MAG TPA: pectate lyase, partial [Opitutaceae bacterium]|nr:pectate lyase [Opitutaceae bacterium]
LHADVTWSQALRQPTTWYASDEAVKIGEAVLTYQTPSGGWPKNWEMSRPEDDSFRQLREAERAPTIDNGATTTQIRFLALVAEARAEPRFTEAVARGIDYLFAAQYANGGWPQFFPLRTGYYTHITFNDNAMVNVLSLLRDVARGETPFTTLDASRRARASRAVERGIVCILRCQIETDGVKTVWCAQHDETTLAPAAARKFEPACLTGGESVGIVRFLMQQPNPSPEMIRSVQAAVAWFERVKLTGVRWDRVPAPGMPKGVDAVLVEDPKADPLWARFYEIGTNRPLFMGRDAVVRYSVAEIEHERRIGYAWYVTSPRTLLEREYPRWAKQWVGSSH